MSSTIYPAGVQPGYPVLRPWRKRRPATPPVAGSVVEPSACADAQLSTPEPALGTAADFWLAAADRRLIAHLQPDPLGRLHVARTAFAELGLVGVADLLADTMTGLRRAWSKQHVYAQLSKLEMELPSSRDRLDEVMACLADSYAERQRVRQLTDASGAAAARG